MRYLKTKSINQSIFNIEMYIHICRAFPGDSAVKNFPAYEGDMGLIPAIGRSPGGRNGNPLQYSYLGDPMDRGAW